MGRYLVTGGAGFIGSHLVAALLDRDDTVVVLDNLRQGHAEAVLAGAQLVVGDLADARLVDALLADGPWDAVFHFAALSLVGESMRAPFRYLTENAGAGIGLIEACVRHDVRRFVLSSTANLFGETAPSPIGESAPVCPQSPYGESKAMLERALFWADRVHGLRSACLRYFNAAGADPAGRLGEDHAPETHLIPLAIDSALGRHPPLSIFGTDYPTPDGTCIRDYVHVSDLADAHLGVLDVLRTRSRSYNVGNGRGYSVQQVIACVGRLVGRPVPCLRGARRPGDPAMLVADATLLRDETGWSPRFSTLEDIIGSALRWRLQHPDGYADTLKALVG